MYFEYFGSHYATSRHQQLLAEAKHNQLLRLARAAPDAGAPHAAALPHGRRMPRVAARAGGARVTSLLRRAAMWLGTLLVRWGQALQVRADPPDAAAEASIPW